VLFLDESGFTLTPYVANTWAPRGQVPVLVHAMGHWEKLNAISAVAFSRRQGRVRADLFFRLHRGRSIGSARVAAFLRQVERQVPGRVIVVWDNAPQHRGPYVRAFFAKRPRFELVRLPPYCPELNPDEDVWSWVKSKDLANAAAQDNDDLVHRVRGSLRRMQRRAHLVRGCLTASELPWGALLE
jgi:putative transposase